jgi:hypothetical protein
MKKLILITLLISLNILVWSQNNVFEVFHNAAIYDKIPNGKILINIPKWTKVEVVQINRLNDDYVIARYNEYEGYMRIAAFNISDERKIRENYAYNLELLDNVYEVFHSTAIYDKIPNGKILTNIPKWTKAEVIRINWTDDDYVIARYNGYEGSMRIAAFNISDERKIRENEFNHKGFINNNITLCRDISSNLEIITEPFYLMPVLAGVQEMRDC